VWVRVVGLVPIKKNIQSSCNLPLLKSEVENMFHDFFSFVLQILVITNFSSNKSKKHTFWNRLFLTLA
jgi:hypothetical protein